MQGLFCTSAGLDTHRAGCDNRATMSAIPPPPTVADVYAMEAVFFRAKFVGEPVDPGEYELCWLDGSQPDPPFFHACHGWAARQP
jgi:hypothetical protein